jgi:hypothetical protein
MKKINCWEFFNCGREPGGEKVEELGICPAAISTEFEGVNDGEHGGRFCWVVAGTFCKGEVQGTNAKKFKDCINCDFLKYVNEENGREFILTSGNYKINTRDHTG